MEPITGECFCRAVTYRINQPLRDARSCHCSRCRKAFNAQASAYAEVEPGSFQWTSGEGLLTAFDTGNDFGLQFCSRCGSTLCGTYADEVHGITLGCVNGDPNVEIGQHIYVDSKAAWEVMPQGENQFVEGSPRSKT